MAKKHEPEWRKLLVQPPVEWQALPVVARGVGTELLRVIGPTDSIPLEGRPPWQAVAMLVGAHPRERLAVKNAVDALMRGGFLWVRAGSLVVEFPEVRMASSSRRADDEHASSARRARVEHASSIAPKSAKSPTPDRQREREREREISRSENPGADRQRDGSEGLKTIGGVLGDDAYDDGFDEADTRALLARLGVRIGGDA